RLREGPAGEHQRAAVLLAQVAVADLAARGVERGETQRIAGGGDVVAGPGLLAHPTAGPLIPQRSVPGPSLTSPAPPAGSGRRRGSCRPAAARGHDAEPPRGRRSSR